MNRALMLALTVVSAAALAGCENGLTSGPRVPGSPPHESVSNPSAATMEAAAAARSTLTNTPAPPFTMLNQDGKPISLGDYRGQWLVLYFYPKDDTPGCACQATEFTELLMSFRDMNSQIVGVSTDSPATHKIFIEKYHLGMNLLSDRDHQVHVAYGAWVPGPGGDAAKGHTLRSTFIIDPQGVIRYHCNEVIPTGHAGRIRKILGELQKS